MVKQMQSTTCEYRSVLAGCQLVGGERHIVKDSGPAGQWLTHMHMVSSTSHENMRHTSRKCTERKFQGKPELNQSQASLGRDSVRIKYAILCGKGQERR